MRIITMTKADQHYIQQAAQLLVDGFKENWPDAWPTLADALTEVEECLGVDRIARIAVDHDEQVLGWIGGIKAYKGFVWEMHPLVVHLNYRRQGIGRRLVEDFEEQVRQRGGITIFIGSDDENSMTSLSNVDLYDDLCKHISNIQNYKGHPIDFYRQLGYKIVGVLPDANGIGKPDIFLAKRVVKFTEEHHRNGD